jgi:hypothetical protein
LLLLSRSDHSRPQRLSEFHASAGEYLALERGGIAREIDRIGDEGLKIAEGVVTRIDRGRKQITIRFVDGKSETLRLTDRAAAEAAKDVDQAATDAMKVIVYFSDEAGRKVAHFFKKASRP